MNLRPKRIRALPAQKLGRFSIPQAADLSGGGTRHRPGSPEARRYRSCSTVERVNGRLFDRY